MVNSCLLKKIEYGNVIRETACGVSEGVMCAEIGLSLWTLFFYMRTGDYWWEPPPSDNPEAGCIWIWVALMPACLTISLSYCIGSAFGVYSAGLLLEECERFEDAVKKPYKKLLHPDGKLLTSLIFAGLGEITGLCSLLFLPDYLGWAILPIMILAPPFFASIGFSLYEAKYSK